MASVTGAAEMKRRLLDAARAFPVEMVAAVRAELEIEATESQRRTPVEFGALRASHVVDVQATSDDIVGTIGVGGPSAPYAVYVHENLDAHHDVGQAKFLESTLAESARFLPARVAKRFDLSRVVR